MDLKTKRFYTTKGLFLKGQDGFFIDMCLLNDTNLLKTKNYFRKLSLVVRTGQIFLFFYAGQT